MIQNTGKRTRLLSLGLALLLLAAPARAADIDPYLPADTEVVLILNIKQILNSGLVKKVGVENLRAALMTQQEVADVLKDLGLDPFKDVDSVVSAGPSTGEEDKGLIIVHGRFNLEKIRATAKKHAEDNKDILKITKVKDGQGGEHTIYEVTIAELNKTLYVGLASEKTILAALSKDYLIDGLKVKPDATKAALKNKNFQELLSKLDPKQSMSVALIGDVLTKGALADLPIKDKLAKVTVASGGVTLTDGIKIEFNIATKEAKDAEEMRDDIANGINAGVGLIALLAAQNKQLAPLADFLKAIKTTAKEKVVTVKAEYSAEDLKKLMPKDQ